MRELTVQCSGASHGIGIELVNGVERSTYRSMIRADFGVPHPDEVIRYHLISGFLPQPGEGKKDIAALPSDQLHYLRVLFPQKQKSIGKWKPLFQVESCPNSH